MIVVSDRRVIDGQLQDAIFDFERTQGVVETIKNEGGAKGGQLAKALAAGKKIIVCTIQVLPNSARRRAGAGGESGQALRRDRRRSAFEPVRRGGGQAA